MKISADDARRWGMVSTIGPLFGVSVVLGWLAGSWLDRRFGTDPAFMVTGLLVGSAAGFIEVFRILKRIQR
ncbi:MAG: AtpZ/AtpI family protein [Planctomycetes bacterium]|nr:AtpZ/AtpI family protein [Planctomycetota bacterium]